MMNSRERVNTALSHKQPDRIPLDLGACTVTGMHVSIVYSLRQALELDRPGTPVKVIEPYQMLGEIAPDLLDAIGADIVGLGGTRNIFGFANDNWKSWITFDGIPVLVPEGFNTIAEPNGDMLMYPEADKSAPPSGRMPKGGWYFDSIIRQEPIDEEQLNVEDNLEEFGPISAEDLEHYRKEADRLYTHTDKAILLTLPGASFGDVAMVPAVWTKHPKGIRDVEEWYVSTLIRKDYVYSVFDRQCKIAIENAKKIYSVVGDRASVVLYSAADFGTQRAPFISAQTYRDLYKPFHRRLNDWTHRNTSWKVFIHTCGAIMPLMEDFIEAGFDIMNPVQCTAAEMDPCRLKERFGERLSFWGGGVDTQRTLPFGTAEQVRSEVCDRIKIFGPNGGFVFNSIHNIQAKTPIENILVMYRTLQECGGYAP